MGKQSLPQVVARAASLIRLQHRAVAREHRQRLQRVAHQKIRRLQPRDHPGRGVVRPRRSRLVQKRRLFRLQPLRRQPLARFLRRQSLDSDPLLILIMELACTSIPLQRMPGRPLDRLPCQHLHLYFRRHSVYQAINSLDPIPSCLILFCPRSRHHVKACRCLPILMCPRCYLSSTSRSPAQEKLAALLAIVHSSRLTTSLLLLHRQVPSEAASDSPCKMIRMFPTARTPQASGLL